MSNLDDLWNTWWKDGSNNHKAYFNQSFYRSGLFHLGLPINPKQQARNNAGRAWKVACRLKKSHPSLYLCGNSLKVRDNI